MAIEIAPLVGKKFDRLLVLGPSGKLPTDKNLRYVECRCNCGNEVRVAVSTLTRGLIRSCGCLLPEITTARNYKHGLTLTRENLAWLEAKRRCFNPNTKCFKNYGGRGITMCQEWRDDFTRFLSNMGPCPIGYSLERINNDGNYEPRNCKWATRIEQANNKRNVPLIDYKGKRMSAAEWGRLLGIAPLTIQKRLARGWRVACALGNHK